MVDEAPQDDDYTVAEKCEVSGSGLEIAMVRRLATFTIVACSPSGAQREVGGDIFTVAVRGGSLIKARVIDQEDGTYLVDYKPSVSGPYSISVTFNGAVLPGSPFSLNVLTPRPDAARSSVAWIWPGAVARRPRG